MNLRMRRERRLEAEPPPPRGPRAETLDSGAETGLGAEPPRSREAPIRRAEEAPTRTPAREERPARRDLGASAMGALGSGVTLLARLIMTAAVLIALLIGLAIVLRDVDANAHNTIVKGVHEGANFFAGAFTGLIAFNGHPKRAITVDWGIALIVYVIVGALIARSISRVGQGGLRYEETHRAAV